MGKRGINTGVQLRGDLPWYSSCDVFAVPDFPVGLTRGEQCIIDFHAHDFIELVVITAGTGLNQLQEEGDAIRSYSFFQGDVFSILPGDRHGYAYRHELELYNLMFMPEILGSDWDELLRLPVLGRLLAPPPHAPRGKIHLGPALLGRLRRRMDRMIDELKRRAPGYRTASRALLLEILVMLGRAEAIEWHGADRLEEHDKEQKLQRAVLLMEKNLTRTLSLQELALEVRLSPHYFCEQFRRYTGLSPWEYLLRLRLERARELLATTAVPVAEVARAAGFRDHSYFTRSFRACEGLTPSAYRKRLGEKGRPLF